MVGPVPMSAGVGEMASRRPHVTSGGPPRGLVMKLFDKCCMLIFLSSPISSLAQLRCAATINDAAAHRPSNGFEVAPPIVAASRRRPGTASGNVLSTPRPRQGACVKTHAAALSARGPLLRVMSKSCVEPRHVSRLDRVSRDDVAPWLGERCDGSCGFRLRCTTRVWILCGIVMAYSSGLMPPPTEPVGLRHSSACTHRAIRGRYMRRAHLKAVGLRKAVALRPLAPTRSSQLYLHARASGAKVRSGRVSR